MLPQLKLTCTPLGAIIRPAVWPYQQGEAYVLPSLRPLEHRFRSTNQLISHSCCSCNGKAASLGAPPGLQPSPALAAGHSPTFVLGSTGHSWPEPSAGPQMSAKAMCKIWCSRGLSNTGACTHCWPYVLGDYSCCFDTMLMSAFASPAAFESVQCLHQLKHGLHSRLQCCIPFS